MCIHISWAVKMLQKVVTLRNIGRFTNYKSKGDTTFRELTVVYAPNASGKSTLADILRSVSTSDVGAILNRATIVNGVTAVDQNAVLVFDQPKQTVTLEAKPGCWRYGDSKPQIVVFDEAFVSRNIYVGQTISTDQAKSLHGFAFGERGVELSNRLSQIDSELRQHEEKMKAAESQISTFSERLSAKDFVALEPVPDIEQRTSSLKSRIRLAEDADKIKGSPELRPILMPPVNVQALRQLLMAGIDSLSARAEKAVLSRISRASERWIGDGVEFLGAAADSKCPFCGQPIGAESVVHMYKNYFNDAYQAHKEELMAFRDSFLRDFGEAPTRKLIQTTIRTNETNWHFWSEHLHDERPLPDFDGFGEDVASLRESVIQLLETKISAPGEPLGEEDVVTKVEAFVDKLSVNVNEYNATVATVNAEITRAKKSVENFELVELQGDLRQLELISTRYKPDVQGLCKEYSRIATKIDDRKNERKKLRNQLQETTAQFFKEYVDSVNHLLELFGVEFRIGDARSTFVGKSKDAELDYAFVLRGKSVASKVPKNARQDQVGFASFLSAGDRTALALSVFLATLKHDDDLAARIVVVDDPITSLDSQRLHFTLCEVIGLVGKAKQVILLTHNTEFFRRLELNVRRGGLNPQQVKYLTIRKRSEDSYIEEADVPAIIETEYVRDHRVLKEFLEDSASHGLRDVAACARAVLESYLHTHFVASMKPGLSLGQMLGALRSFDTSGSSSPPRLPDSTRRDIEKVNAYLVSHLHSAVAGSGEWDIDELRAIVNQTLEIIQRVG